MERRRIFEPGDLVSDLSDRLGRVVSLEELGRIKSRFPEGKSPGHYFAPGCCPRPEYVTQIPVLFEDGTYDIMRSMNLRKITEDPGPRVLRLEKMFRTLTVGLLSIVLAGFLFLGACRTLPPAEESKVGGTSTPSRPEKTAAVVQVTEGVYAAVGFGLANAILLEGPDGLILVDTLEGVEAVKPVKQAFARISAKPLKAIIYTHNHADHILGTRAFTAGRPVPIWSHASLLRELDQTMHLLRPVIGVRSLRQFGVRLPEDLQAGAGIGTRLKLDRTAVPSLTVPDHTFPGERLSLELAGIRLELLHLPGETPDQIAVWLPDKKVLLPADNYYRAFPNLYAIRGTAYRDVGLWVKSLDTLRSLGAEYLVPSHTEPIVGRDRIFETLTNYRDAIQFVHDQTVRGLNLGWSFDELAERVRLPESLARLPYLQETYGTVAWSVRAVAQGYLGWFDGNARNLFPLAARERAERWVRLAGGAEKTKAEAEKAAAEGDFQWAAELADLLLALDPEDSRVKGLKGRALRELGLRQTSFNGRNYYLTQALELEGALTIAVPAVRDKKTIQAIPLASMFRSMAVHLNPEKCAGLARTVGFRFPDTGEVYTLNIRNGIAETVPGVAEKPDFTITVDSRTWKEILSGLRPAGLNLLKELKTDGSLTEMIRVLNMFKE